LRERAAAAQNETRESTDGNGISIVLVDDECGRSIWGQSLSHDGIENWRCSFKL